MLKAFTSAILAANILMTFPASAQVPGESEDDQQISRAIEQMVRWSLQRNDGTVIGNHIKSGFYLPGQTAKHATCGLLVIYSEVPNFNSFLQLKLFEIKKYRVSETPVPPPQSQKVDEFYIVSHSITSLLTFKKSADGHYILTPYQFGLDDGRSTSVHSTDILANNYVFGFSTLMPDKKILTEKRDENSFEKNYQTRVEWSLIPEDIQKNNVDSASGFDLLSETPNKPAIKCFFQSTF